MNTQPIEKRIDAFDGFYQVHSIFYTLQGEGPFTGTPAVFVRLAGCNLQCPQCDTDYTSKRQLLDADAIRHLVERLYPGTDPVLVVITGGEPFRQQLTKLLNTLTDAGHYVQIETNGTLEPSLDVMYTKATDLRTGVYVVCSPKAGKVNRHIERIACCYKYVLNASNVDPGDGLPMMALDHPAHPRVARPPAGYTRPVYVQPVDTGNDELNLRNRDASVRSCMRHGYILQLQTHKILGLE